MAGPDLKVQIDADVAKFEAGLERARRSTMRMEDQLAKANLAAAQLDKQLEDEAARAAQKRADAMEKLGRGLVAFGTATLAGLGFATKAAIDWESAWAGVRKTQSGSAEEIARLEGELREMANTLPATHAEIAAVAEAAGQLGVATPDVARFTRTMIDLGETTNLSAEEAAMAIAKFMNVMQTAPDKVSNLGSALVALGNNSATTERDILMLAQRLSAAGALVGMTEADVLGFAAAMSSVGIQAEAGGTAVSRVMSDMSSAVSQGGDKLEGFAQVAGMSAEEFARAFREDPAQAIVSFIDGLGTMRASGEDVFTTLNDLGLGGLRVRDTLLSLSGAGDLLSESLDLSAEAFAENTALVEEAAQRYDTAESKIAMAKNALVNFAIDIGGVILPHIANLADGANSLLQVFSDLPGPVKTAATVLAGLLGSAALVSGTFLLLAPRLRAAKDLIGDLGPGAQRAAGWMGALGKAAAIGAVLTGVALAIDQITMSSKTMSISVEDATRALLDLRAGKAAVEIDELRASLETAQDAANPGLFERLAANVGGFGMTARGAEADVRAFSTNMQEFDAALTSMVQSGAIDQAEESARQLQLALGMENVPFEKFVSQLLPGYKSSLQGLENDQRLAAEGAGGLATGLDDVGDSADEAAEALDEYLDALKRSTDPVFALMSAVQSVDQAQQAYNEAVEEYGRNSVEAEQAAIDVAKAVADLEAAVLNGDLSFEAFSTELDRWVSMGYVTEEQAEAIRSAVADATGAAEDFTGNYQANVSEQGAKESETKIDHATAAAKIYGGQRPSAKLNVDRKNQQLHTRLARDDLRNYGRISRKATIGVNDRASRGIRGIIDLIRQVRDKTVTIHTLHRQTGVGGGGSRVDMRASGGPVTMGREYLVGERGPELFRAPATGHIYSATQTAAMLSSRPVSSSPVPAMSGGGGGGRDVRVWFDFTGIDSKMASALREMVRTGEL